MGDVPKRLFRVPRVVVVQLIVLGPELHERRHRGEKRPVGSEQFDDTPKCPYRVSDVLQHIQHQDELVRLAGPKVPVERSHIDPLSMAAAVGDQTRRGLDALYLAPQLEQFGKEESIAAPHVQNVPPPTRRPEPMEVFENHLLAGPPPPVLLKPLSIDMPVVGFHLRLPFQSQGRSSTTAMVSPGGRAPVTAQGGRTSSRDRPAAPLPPADPDRQREAMKIAMTLVFRPRVIMEIESNGSLPRRRRFGSATRTVATPNAPRRRRIGRDGGMTSGSRASGIRTSRPDPGPHPHHARASQCAIGSGDEWE